MVLRFIALFGGFLKFESLTNHYVRTLMLVFKRCAHDDHMQQNLPHLITDSHVFLEELGHVSVIDPVETIGRLMYQLMHRMIGTHDIAKSIELVDQTREIYKPLEESSLFELWFPLFPTPSKLRKIWGYARLHWLVRGFVTDRRETGRVETDAMQMMIDQGCSDPVISLVCPRCPTNHIVASPS